MNRILITVVVSIFFLTGMMVILSKPAKPAAQPARTIQYASEQFNPYLQNLSNDPLLNSWSVCSFVHHLNFGSLLLNTPIFKKDCIPAKKINLNNHPGQRLWKTTIAMAGRVKAGSYPAICKNKTGLNWATNTSGQLQMNAVTNSEPGIPQSQPPIIKEDGLGLTDVKIVHGLLRVDLTN